MSRRRNSEHWWGLPCECIPPKRPSHIGEGDQEGVKREVHSESDFKEGPVKPEEKTDKLPPLLQLLKSSQGSSQGDTNK